MTMGRHTRTRIETRTGRAERRREEWEKANPIHGPEAPWQVKWATRDWRESQGWDDYANMTSRVLDIAKEVYADVAREALNRPSLFQQLLRDRQFPMDDMLPKLGHELVLDQIDGRTDPIVWFDGKPFRRGG